MSIIGNGALGGAGYLAKEGCSAALATLIRFFYDWYHNPGKGTLRHLVECARDKVLDGNGRKVVMDGLNIAENEATVIYSQLGGQLVTEGWTAVTAIMNAVWEAQTKDPPLDAKATTQLVIEVLLSKESCKHMCMLLVPIGR